MRRARCCSSPCASAPGRPDLIVDLDGVFGTGPGNKGYGGGIVLSKSYDPAVLFAGINYLHGNNIDPADPAALAREA